MSTTAWIALLILLFLAFLITRPAIAHALWRLGGLAAILLFAAFALHGLLTGHPLLAAGGAFLACIGLIAEARNTPLSPEKASDPAFMLMTLIGSIGACAFAAFMIFSALHQYQ